MLHHLHHRLTRQNQQKHKHSGRSDTKLILPPFPTVEKASTHQTPSRHILGLFEHKLIKLWLLGAKIYESKLQVYVRCTKYKPPHGEVEFLNVSYFLRFPENHCNASSFVSICSPLSSCYFPPTKYLLKVES